jgi:hypothetical protein
MEISNRSPTQKLQRNELDLFVGISNVRHLQQKSRTTVIKLLSLEKHMLMTGFYLVDYVDSLMAMGFK